MSDDAHDWPFDDPPNVAVMALDRILEGNSPVLLVCHDEDDGMWQFLDGQEVSEEDAKIYIAQAVCVEVYDVMKNKKPYNRERYIKNLERLPQEPSE